MLLVLLCYKFLISSRSREGNERQSRNNKISRQDEGRLGESRQREKEREDNLAGKLAHDGGRLDAREA